MPGIEGIHSFILSRNIYQGLLCPGYHAKAGKIVVRAEARKGGRREGEREVGEQLWEARQAFW